MTKSNFPIEYFRWKDHSTNVDGWTFLDELEPPQGFLIESIGFVISENEEAVQIASCVSVGEEHRDVASQIGTILKNCIIERVVVSE